MYKKFSIFNLLPYITRALTRRLKLEKLAGIGSQMERSTEKEVLSGSDSVGVHKRMINIISKEKTKLRLPKNFAEISHEINALQHVENNSKMNVALHAFLKKPQKNTLGAKAKYFDFLYFYKQIQRLFTKKFPVSKHHRHHLTRSSPVTCRTSTRRRTV